MLEMLNYQPTHTHPENFTSYFDFILSIAKSLQLKIQQPPPDLVYSQINRNFMALVHVGTVPSVLDLVKES